MESRIKKWGNSFGIRLTKADLDRLGLTEGDEVVVDLRPAAKTPGRLALPPIPTVKDDDPDASIRHDELLYGRRP